MAYNPGITDRSGEILAQGTAAAAQIRMQGYQNATNSLLKGFSDLSKKQQEEEVKRNETLAKFKSDPSLALKLSEKGNEDLKAKYDKLNKPTDGFWAGLAGRGDKADSDLLAKFATGTQEATVRRYQADEADRQVKAGEFLQAEATRKATEATELGNFRDRVDADYNRGEKTRGDYNTYLGIQESLRNINAPSTIGAGAIPQTPGPAVSSLGMNRPQSVFGSQTLPQFDSQMSPSASGVPPALSRFEPAPMQINAPQSVFGLDQSKVRQAPPSAEFDTPEKINELLYNYTPGSDSAMQRIRAYGRAITPAIMQGENEIEARRVGAAATDARRRAVEANTEIRRREAAIQQARDEARAAATFEMAQRNEKRLIEQDTKRDAQTTKTNTRADAADRRAENTANEPPAIGTVVAGDLGATEQRRLESINKEIDNNPQAKEALIRIRKKFGVVPKERAQEMKEYINSLPISTGAKNLILGETRE